MIFHQVRIIALALGNGIDKMPLSRNMARCVTISLI